MSFSGGVFSLVAGNPVVTGTTISSTTMNNTLSDIATGLSTCVLKDGSQTVTANIPMSSFKFTGLAAGSASGDSLRYEQVNGLVTTAGDILQASGAGTLARLAIGTARQLPAVNSGATALAYQDQITLGTEQAATSGTAINFTGIPASVKRVCVHFVNVSTTGTSDLIVQIGPSGGVENTSYVSSAGLYVNAGAITVLSATAGFALCGATAGGNLLSGTLTLTLENASSNTWVASGDFKTGTTAMASCAGNKSIAGVLNKLTITTVGGVDTFDQGTINITYE